MKIEFLNRLSEKVQMPSFIKIRPVGAELLHADRQIVKHDAVNNSFSEFCERA